MNKKKILMIILVVLIILLLFWLIIFQIDYYRCSHFKTPIFTTSGRILDIGHEEDINVESHIDYCYGYHVSYLTTMNLENNSREIKEVSMYLFGKCILSLSNEKI